jgi:ATPase family associated with various cellular activities (AAA)
MTLTTDIRHLQTLIMSFHPIVVMETVEEERVQTLLNKATLDLQLPVFEWSIAQGLCRLDTGQQNRWHDEFTPPGSSRPAVIEETAEPLAVLRHIQAMRFRALYWLKDFSVHLNDDTVARLFREISHQFSGNQSALVVTGEQVNLPKELVHEAVFFDVPLPEKEELHEAILQAIRTLKGRISVNLSPEEMQLLVRAVRGMTLKQTKKVIAYAALEDGELTVKDIARVLKRKTQIIHETGLLDYIPLEQNNAQLGGFTRLKQWLARARVGFSEEARSFNLTPPKGILIVGVQGCGKSLAAKTIAQTWKMPLLKLDAGRLYDKYVGESEKNFRQSVSLAEKMAPVVLWIDEIEKSMGNVGGDADGGLSRRLFGSFLTWLQEKSHEVFVVATANDLSQIPPELLRKGRFDEIFFVDLPAADERETIFRIHLTRHRQDPKGFDFLPLVQASEGFSGAEIEQVIIATLYRAIYERVPVNGALILDEIKATVPLSVSRREDVQALRQVARERFVSVR